KVAKNHRRKRNKTLETSWNLFASKAETLNKSQFKEGVQWLGVNLTNEESNFVFDRMNTSKSGLLTLKEFKNDVKDDIPVPLASVVNIRDILIRTFQRHLEAFHGKPVPIRGFTTDQNQHDDAKEMLQIHTDDTDTMTNEAQDLDDLEDKQRGKKQSTQPKTNHSNANANTNANASANANTNVNTNTNTNTNTNINTNTKVNTDVSKKS
ncbi:hypothetical protein RFI_26174, partial [Reticulomyxa filosa]